MFNPNQKRLLALDGGGILGAISIQILKEIETQLREVSGAGDEFRLRDFFDYFAGTSTGAIIAAGLAIGKSVDELDAFYQERGEEMFQRAKLMKRWRHKYSNTALSALLKAEFMNSSICELQASGALSRDKHLLVVTRNVETDSPWPISSNPAALFNDTSLPDCNLNIPLWQLVRASTAAPTFFAPERLQWDPKDPDKQFYFEDGGVTPYNNPAFILYRMATQPTFKCNWPSGEDKMMLVSVGTGSAARALEDPDADGEGLISTATTIAGELMRGISIENDINCRTFGRCVSGAKIDAELGDMVEDHNPNNPKAFLYARYEVDSSSAGLEALGLSDINPDDLTLDNVDAVPDLVRIGQAAAKEVDMAKQFPAFMPGG
ncbi:MAG: patatin-like phospholipase family protein [Pseudomonadota bacterium]